MVLTEELQKVVHLIAQAIARTHGAEDAAPFADTVLEHAKAIAGEMDPDAPKEPVVESSVTEETPAVAEQNVIAQ